MSESIPTLYTIGHSNHELDHFAGLLVQHRIQVLADVRSAPWSRYTPHFNSESLKHSLPGLGIQYLFLGDQLGGRPDGAQLYDDSGHVLYSLVAETESFRTGVRQLKDAIQTQRVAIMCSEENPSVCHRFLLVTRVMADDNVEILHIRGDGTVATEKQIRATSGDDRDQGMLFQELEQDVWRSLKPIMPKTESPD